MTELGGSTLLPRPAIHIPMPDGAAVPLVNVAVYLRRLQIDMAVERVIPQEFLKSTSIRNPMWDRILLNAFCLRIQKEFKKIARQSPIYTAREILDER